MSEKLSPSSGEEENRNQEARRLEESDLDYFRAWFTYNEIAVRQENQHFVLHENYLYDFLTNDFSPKEKISQEDVPVEQYDQLIASLINLWRQGVSKGGAISRIKPEYRDLVLKAISGLSGITTARQFRSFLRDNPEIMKILPIKYQNFNLDPDEMTSGFLQINMGEVNGYCYQRPKSDMPIYLNPKLKFVPQLTTAVINACQRNQITLYLKMIDYSCEGVDLEKRRSDRIVIYTDKQNFEKTQSVIADIYESHPEWLEGRRPPFLTKLIAPGVGAGENLSPEQRTFAGSFSDVRVKLLYNCFFELAREALLYTQTLT